MEKIGTITIANKVYHKPTENDFYCGRGSCVGNPYSHKKSAKAIVVQDRETAINLYKVWLDKQLLEENRNTPQSIAIRKLFNQIYLAVKNSKDVFLVCYCAPKNCHTEYIKEIILSKF